MLYFGAEGQQNGGFRTCPNRFSDSFSSSTLAIWPPNAPHQLGFLRRPFRDFLRVGLPRRPAKRHPNLSHPKSTLKRILDVLEEAFREKWGEGTINRIMVGRRVVVGTLTSTCDALG